MRLTPSMAAALFVLAVPELGCGDDSGSSDTGGSTSGASATITASASATVTASAGLDTTTGTATGSATTDGTSAGVTTGDTVTDGSTGMTGGTTAVTTGATTSQATDSGTATTDGGTTAAGTTGATGGGTSGGSGTGATTGGPTQAYEACVVDADCLGPGEVCLHNNDVGGANHNAVCAQADCTTPTECPDNPGGGTAVVACGDPDGAGGNECYLSCTAMGTVCPAGMACTAAAGTSVCAWPSTWTCDFGLLGDTNCNCGCGMVDPDCADAGLGTCDQCNNPGSCAANEADCTTIEPMNNGVCTPPV